MIAPSQSKSESVFCVFEINMMLERTFLSCFIGTVVATIRLFPRVNKVVVLEASLVYEGLVAHWTDIGTFLIETQLVKGH